MAIVKVKKSTKKKKTKQTHDPCWIKGLLRWMGL